MNIFKLNVEFSSSLDGKKLIVKDISNYINNDEGYTLSSFILRKVELRYADNNIVDIYDFPLDDLNKDSIAIIINKDKYISITFKLTLNPSIIVDKVYTFEKNIGYNANVKYKQYLLIDKDFCKQCSNNQNDINRIETFIQQAKFAGRFYDGLNFNKYIDAANELLNIDCKC